MNLLAQHPFLAGAFLFFGGIGDEFFLELAPDMVFIEHGPVDLLNDAALLLPFGIFEEFLLLADLTLAEFPLLLEFETFPVIFDDVEGGGVVI